jgi:hypothetical protein
MEILWFSKCWNCHKHVLSWIELSISGFGYTYVNHQVGVNCKYEE